MVESGIDPSLLILLIGATIVLNIMVKCGLERIGVPALIGYMALGFLIAVADVQAGFLSADGKKIFEFLARLGVITLLFRIGLESNITGLLQQLRRASFIWIGGVFFCGALGYVTAYYLLGLALIPSLFIAIALTATSVGIPAGVWQGAGAINSPNGELLIDVAELDDISGIILMALLFAVVPVLQEGLGKSLLPILAETSGLILLKLAVFGTLCALFSIFVERRITGFFGRIVPPPNPMLVVGGIGFIMAALARLLGFSLAIGAFFAGLVFSRDPEAVKIEASFEALYDLFSPFFFIGIGLYINPQVLTTALEVGTLLLVVAVLGKLIGHGFPTLLSLGWTAAVLIGFSMVPRAEIAMIIMEHGLSLGAWAVPPQVYAAMVLVSAMTCIFSPIIVRALLRRWPQTEGGGTQ